MKFIIPLCFLFVFTACGKSDKKISDEVNAKITGSNPTVRATVHDGVVTLTGTCPDASCKNVSENAAKDVDGVKSVVNNITIDEPAPPAVTINPDDSLNTAVNDVLKNYKNVKADVSNGVVTLTGEIKRSQLSELMQDITETKPKKIENKLQIK